MSAFRSLLLVTAVLAATGTKARGQNPERPSLTAVRLGEGSGPMTIRIDGLLDEAVWQRAPLASDFRQQEPVEGAPATEQTEVRVAYDAGTLYVGVLARDSQSDQVIARILARDKVMMTGFDGRPLFAGDDAVAILLDPFHDHRNAVVFATNPLGAEFDALITDEGREFNIDWRGVWRVAARRTPQGWSAEFAIPFRTLRFPSGGGSEPWGFNIYRIIRRKNEQVLWSSWSRANEGFTRVSRAGHLGGLTDLPRAGINLELKPYVLSGVTQERETPAGIDTEPRAEAGLDLKYEVRPGLLLDLTVNTDFAQVEVDDEQVNLTRFSLFFPEKRDFFLENAGIFQFGTRGFFEPPPFLLFFSRRIGISDEGEVPVIGGARLTGRVGGQTIGFLDVVTDRRCFDCDDPGNAVVEPRANFAVLRMKRDIGASHYVGAMLADRRSADEWNTAGGLDWSFWPTGTLNVQGFVAATAASGAGGEDYAYRLGLDYQTSRFGFTGQHLAIGPEATADMGFITRTDIRRTGGFGRFTPRPRILGLRKLDLFVNAQVITRTDGVLQDWTAGPALAPEWNSGESFAVFYLPGFTRLDEGFDLTDDVAVPAGDYDIWQLGWFANTSRNRPVVLGSIASIQRFFDGDLLSVSGNLTVSPNPHLALTLGYTRNDVDVPGGAFTADVGSLRLAYAFSTRLFLNALVQYNSLDRTVSANVRLNFIHRPGSDLFIVFNEVRERVPDTSVWDLDKWDLSNRGAVVKVTYLGRL